MKKRRTASTSKVPLRHGEGERQFPNILSTTNVATSRAVNRNSNRPISIFCSGNTSLENNIGTPQPEVQTPLSRLDMHSALTDITNTHSNGELIQSNISGLTFEHNINLTPSGIPKSYSVNQKKREKRRSEQISQVAAELCSRLNESEEGNIFNVTQDTGANFSQSLKFSYLDEGDAMYGCKFCGAQMWLSESLKRVRKSEPPQFSMCFDLQITNANKEAAGLANIQQLLLRNGRSLNDYPSMPKPDNDLIIDTLDQLILQELNYNKEKEMETSSRFERLMTEEQKKVYEQIINAVSSKKGGIPHHKLVLKVGVPVMLIKNIDQAAGLCNGTRLQITQLGKNVIKAKALNGTSVGEDILIHRVDMNPSECKLPFTLTRQFPIIISFAMTINKSQGQSMTNVGLYLPTPVFSHGQLYVALSRVKSFNGLKLLILDEFNKCSNTTTNVVYREVFQNLAF
ncbi:hypothetical protein K1719_010555 [Acacia pycnantha]|nr:hypothetical protein K1719_010555 [Acacia pycnantha]